MGPAAGLEANHAHFAVRVVEEFLQWTVSVARMFARYKLYNTFVSLFLQSSSYFFCLTRDQWKINP